MPDRILEGLDPEQRLVAETLDRPVVVLAGAGTGKTRAITHRVAYGVRTGAYDPRGVLAVTFTTRAAGEMRARLASLGVRQAQARTIHAAALRQCRYFWPHAYGVEFPNVADNTFGIIARAASASLGDVETALIRDLEVEIGWAKSTNVTPEDYPALAAQHEREVAGASAAQVAAIMAAYEKAKQNMGVVDFHDLLLCNAVLLSEHPVIAEQIRGQYQHFVVDEYQDISALQHRLISLWVDDRDDICVVGDPNQSIHSFAGADPSFLRGFAKERPEATTIHLVRNYRSSPEILNTANYVLRPRRDEILVPTQASGEQPQIVASGTATNEAYAIADWLQSRHQAGTPWQELAVLYRINAQSPALEAALDERRIPYNVRGSERFYERPEVRQAVGQILVDAANAPDDAASELIDRVLAGVGWTPEAPRGQGRVRERWESVNALRDMLTEEIAQNISWRAADIAAWLRERASWEHGPIADAVTLSTMHAAKGLEWDDVAVIGVREGLVPFSLAQEGAALEEERRLLYVAITRAKRTLHMTWNYIGAGGKQQRSRFLTGLSMGEKEAPPAATARAPQSRACVVCGRILSTGAERKMRRHEDCELPIDEALFERLKTWRKDTAQAASLPAFVVFTDATLMAIAEAKPTDDTELLAIPGIGRAKLAKYGDDVLKVIEEYS